MTTNGKRRRTLLAALLLGCVAASGCGNGAPGSVPPPGPSASEANVAAAAETSDNTELLKEIHAVLVDLRRTLGPETQERVEGVLGRSDALLSEATPPLLSAVRDLEETARTMKEAAPGIAKTMTEVDALVKDVGDSLRDSSSHFQVAAFEIRRAVGEADLSGLATDVRAAGANVRKLTEQEQLTQFMTGMTATMDDVRSLVAELRMTVRTNSEVLSSTVDNLHASTLVLQDFLKIVRSNPGVLLAPPRTDN